MSRAQHSWPASNRNNAQVLIVVLLGSGLDLAWICLVRLSRCLCTLHTHHASHKEISPEKDLYIESSLSLQVSIVPNWCISFHLLALGKIPYRYTMLSGRELEDLTILLPNESCVWSFTMLHWFATDSPL